MTIRGGFTGTESSASARAASARTILDGCGVSDIFSSTGVASGTIAFDGLVFEHTPQSAVKMTGAGGLDIRNCKFFGCGLVPPAVGAGLYVDAAVAFLSSNVVFDSCLSMEPFDSNHSDYAYAMFLKGLSGTARLLDTDVLNCGYPVANNCSRSYANGSAVRIENTKFSCERCEFRGCGTQVNNVGGVIRLQNSCGGSAFTNCAFVGNHAEGYSTDDGTKDLGAVLSVVLNSNAAAIDVVGCTFAYNVAPMKICATALTANKGTVNVIDSIFHGNKAWTANGGAADIFAAANGTVNVTSTMFDGTGAVYVGSSGGGTVNLPAVVLTGDPLFATPEATFAAMLNTCTDGKTYTYLVNGRHYLDFDMHLQSSEGRWQNGAWVKTDTALSPAIDKGTLAYDNEPAPNGAARNLGAYGNTAEASKSPQVVPEFKDFAIDTGCDYTQPHFTFEMTGSGAYSATLYICWQYYTPGGTGIEGWDNVLPFSSVAYGDKVEAYPCAYFEPGKTVYWRVLAIASYGSASQDGNYYVTGSLPPWYQKGGPANVIHVRQGATGRETGLNWTDAYTSLDAALQSLSAERNEIWFSGEFLRSGESPTVSLATPVIFRGGFDGSENAAAERKAATPNAVLRGDATDYVLRFDGASALTVERIDFTGYSKNGVKLSGAAERTFTGCRFMDCTSWFLKSAGGQEHHALAQTGGSLAMTNCCFAGNAHTNVAYSSTENPYGACGMALCLSGVSRTEVVDTTFVTNGIAVYYNQNTPAREDAQGIVVYANNSPIRFLRCGFLGNRGLAHNITKTGSLVYLTGASGGSSFENCRFVGNSTRLWSDSIVNSNGGALSVELSSAASEVGVTNCTFAYNFYVGGPSATALNVVEGKVHVLNSVFHGNLVYTNKLGVADICVGASGSADVAWSFFDSTNQWHLANAGTLMFGEGVRLTDPMLISKFADFRAVLKNASYATQDLEYPWVTTSVSIDWGEKTSSAAGLDVHEAKRSVSRDAGDPASPYANEPAPNGKRINLGCYGNTREALHSPNGLQIIVR